MKKKKLAFFELVRLEIRDTSGVIKKVKFYNALPVLFCKSICYNDGVILLVTFIPQTGPII